MHFKDAKNKTKKFYIKIFAKVGCKISWIKIDEKIPLYT